MMISDDRFDHVNDFLSLLSPGHTLHRELFLCRLGLVEDVRTEQGGQVVGIHLVTR